LERSFFFRRICRNANDPTSTTAAATPPMVPPAITPAWLCDCDTIVELASDVVVATGPVVEGVELVESGRRLKFEVGRDGEKDGLLVVVDEDGLNWEPEEVWDEPVAVASRPLTAQAQMGGEVAGCAPQAKPVHELDRESSSF
jgi:hypothetical protein